MDGLGINAWQKAPDLIAVLGHQHRSTTAGADPFSLGREERQHFVALARPHWKPLVCLKRRLMIVLATTCEGCPHTEIKTLFNINVGSV